MARKLGNCLSNQTLTKYNCLKKNMAIKKKHLKNLHLNYLQPGINKVAGIIRAGLKSPYQKKEVGGTSIMGKFFAQNK